MGKSGLNAETELLKIIAEQNREQIFEYEVETDIAYIYEVNNGQFIIREEIPKFSSEYGSLNHRISNEDRDAFEKMFRRCLSKPQHSVMDVRFPVENGEVHWNRIYMVSMAEEGESEVSLVAARIISIDQEKSATELIRKKAELDSLTGIYNRKTFEKKSREGLLEHEDEAFFLMLDVDDFKTVNDMLGHAVGDSVLIQTAEILKGTIGANGYAGRLGGDEFAAMVFGYNTDEEIHAFCDKLVANLKTIIYDMEYAASIGVGVRKGRNLTFEDMYSEADQAVYGAKKNGKNQYVLYHELDLLEKTEEVHQESEVDYRDQILEGYQEYMFVISEETKHVVYANQSAKDAMKQKAKAWTEISYADFFTDPMDAARYETVARFTYLHRGLNGESPLWDWYEEPNFYLQSRTTIWEGKPARLIGMINLASNKHFLNVMKSRQEVRDAIVNSILRLAECGESDHYAHSLRILGDFYDADCIAVIPAINERPEQIWEYHKESAENLSRLLRISVENGKVWYLNRIEDENGQFFIPNIKAIESIDKSIYTMLAEARVWSLLGITLKHRDEALGKIILINPRRKTSETSVLQLLSVYLSSNIMKNRLAKQQEYFMTHDRLTGVWNRGNLGHWQNEWEKQGYQSLGILMLDIISLSEINRKYGYATGNRRLCEAAELLSTVFSGYQVFRYDEDCMLVVCPDIDKNSMEMMENIVKEKIHEEQFPFALGYAWRNNPEWLVMIQEATNMIESIKVSTISDRADSERKQVAIETQAAIAEGRFKVYLQPKVNIRSCETVGAEALVRYVEEDGKVVAPIYFIPILEQNHIVHMVDMFVFEQVAKFQSEAMKENKDIVPISVNLSKETLLHTDLLERIVDVIASYDIPYNSIKFEITESVGDLNGTVVGNVIDTLRALGFDLSMDDFGTAYSNMEMLFHYPFDTAKIDRSMIRDMVNNEKNVVVVKHISSMLKELGINCVVEGVENKEQVDLLREMDIEVVQGFYFGRPVPSAEFYDKYMNKILEPEK